jgi:hypothetical protein
MSRSGPDWLFARSATGQIRRGEHDKDLKSISRPVLSKMTSHYCAAKMPREAARMPPLLKAQLEIKAFPTFLFS